MNELRDTVDIANETRGWMLAHEHTWNRITLWSVCLSLAVIGVVDFASWWVLRPMRNRTDLGFWLKYKKLFQGIAELSLALVFGLAIWATWHSVEYNVFIRYAVRALASVSFIIAAMWGIGFLISMVRRRRSPTYGTNPDMMAQ